MFDDLHQYLNDMIEYVCNIPIPDNNCLPLKDESLYSILQGLYNILCAQPPPYFHCTIDFLNLDQYQEVTVNIDNMIQEIFGEYLTDLGGSLSDIMVSCYIELLEFLVLSRGPLTEGGVAQSVKWADPRLYLDPVPEDPGSELHPDLGEYAFCRYHVDYDLHRMYDINSRTITFSLGPQGLLYADPENLSAEVQSWHSENYTEPSTTETFVYTGRQRTRVSYRLHITGGHYINYINLYNQCEANPLPEEPAPATTTAAPTSTIAPTTTTTTTTTSTTTTTTTTTTQGPCTFTIQIVGCGPSVLTCLSGHTLDGLMETKTVDVGADEELIIEATEGVTICGGKMFDKWYDCTAGDWVSNSSLDNPHQAMNTLYLTNDGSANCGEYQAVYAGETPTC